MTHPKTIHQGSRARQELLAGARVLASAVSRTLGPQAGTALLDRPAGILATKDGVTVAREVFLAHPLRNLGARILLDACLSVGDEVGDGTSTAAVLAYQIAAHGHRLVVAGHDLRLLLDGIRNAEAFARSRLEALAADVEDEGVLEHVALVAANYDAEVAEGVARAVSSVGKGGSVVVEKGHAVGLEVDLKEGFELKLGACSPYFYRKEGMEGRVLEGALVAVVARPLTTVEDVQSILEESSQWPQNDLLLVAPEIRGKALTTMVMNDGHPAGAIGCVGLADLAFHRRRRGVLDDIAALSRATLIDPVAGYDHTRWDSRWFGTLRQVRVGPSRTLLTAYEDAHGSIQAQVQKLQHERGREEDPFRQDQLQSRIAKLQGGFCILRAGGATEAEIRERMGRIEDSLSAAQAALRGGVLPGGGAALLDAADALQRLGFADGSFGRGQQVLANALQEPLKLLARNSGAEAHRVLSQVREARAEAGVEAEPWIGWDAFRREVRDLGDKPFVLDAAPVPIQALQAAVSAACTLLTVEVAIHDLRR